MLKQDRQIAIQQLSSEAVGIRSIGRLLGCSASYVVKLIKLIASKIKRPVPFEYDQEYELDEMWSYEGNKRKECWLMWIINRRTRQVIDFVVGARNKANIRKLLLKVKGLSPKKIRTDNWTGYGKVFQEVFGASANRVHRCGRRITNRIERGHLTLRTHTKRLTRRTINYTKSRQMFEAIMLLYFNARNWMIFGC